MKQLSKDWLVEGHIDFEYKKYILLGYLRSIRNNFNLNKLYPFLSDLIFHYQNLVALKNKKKEYADFFPKSISEADLRKLEFIYKKVVEDDDIMSELEAIIDFAEPAMKKHLEEGKEIYEFVEEHMEIEPIGLSPLYVDEGYMLVNRVDRSETKAYQFKMSIFQGADEEFRSLNTTYVDSFTNQLGVSFENLKVKLARKNKDLPNPATYLITEKAQFPFESTTLPVAKRMLVRYIVTDKKAR